MADDCIFCRIVRGELPAAEVYRTESLLAFRDITPVAPVHVLVIPTAHIASMSELNDAHTAGEIILAATEVARREGLEPTGYRIVVNTGDHAGQSVGHLHLHVVGGRRLQWPPG